jgi:hypothetical protein
MVLCLNPKTKFWWKRGESEAAMKLTAVVALVMLGLSIPALGQDKTSCNAFFQVLQADTQTPENLRTGMDKAQKKWWENIGQKKYPRMCFNGSVSTGDKPRFLVIWSKSGSIKQTAVAPGEVYGQTLSALQSTAPKERIYGPWWDRASISILSLSSEGNLDLAPVRMTAEDRAHWFRMDSAKVLMVALQYLAQEEEFDSTQPLAAVQPPPLPPPTLTLKVSSTVIQIGQSATLKWSSTNATALNLTPAIGTVAPEGTTAVTPADSTNYTITATGPGGEATATVRITVSFFSHKNDGAKPSWGRKGSAVRVASFLGSRLRIPNAAIGSS